MPLNHIELQDQINLFSKNGLLHRKQIETQLAQALKALERYSLDVPHMQKNGEGAAVRIAIPTQENPNKIYAPSMNTVAYNLVSADGSQIIPDPQDALVFALVNVGIVRISANHAKSIQTLTISELYQYDKLYMENQLINEDMLNLDRDVLEMRYLCENCQGLNGSTVALRDGLLELYHEPRTDKSFQEKFLVYHSYLQSLCSADIITAGYVDKPRSQMVLELLRRCVSDEEGVSSTNPAFPDIIDRQLFDGKLRKGERSAIFENRLPQNNARKPSEMMQFFFFYLNVSQSEKPWTVRVEIPGWVAVDAAKVDLLHTALLEQCSIMGTKPYPYCLHRAHETALVRQEEKSELGKRIQAAQTQVGIPLDEKSYKQSAKDHLPRKTVERKR
ncbi:MAG: DNA double-strand break repair nuclease NurA [Anaerolineaceae bacterium]